MSRVPLWAPAWALAFVLALGVTGRGQTRTRTDDGTSRRGVALTPANFPRHSAGDVENMLRLGREIGANAVFIYQWSQPDFRGVARKMMDASRAAGLTPIIGLSLTTLGEMRGALDVPEPVRRAAG